MKLIYQSVQTLLRTLPAERAHDLSLLALKYGRPPHRALPEDNFWSTQVGGLKLVNPVGLAAGYDKNAEVAAALFGLGFGFVECGTVTPYAQTGNPKPRLFRLASDKAVINRMGFNNAGLERFAGNIQKARISSASGRIIGANLGANKDSTNRIKDYAQGLRRLWGFCDYFTINISSPNTPGLRDLHDSGALEDLLGHISEARIELSHENSSFPIFLKLTPDLKFSQVERITEQVRTYGINGLVISNTTTERPANLTGRHRHQAGGLSGCPLFSRSTELLREFSLASQGRFDLIGVGGILSGADMYEKIRAGAKAIQLYSGLVFGGVFLVQQIMQDARARFEADGFKSFEQVLESVE